MSAARLALVVIAALGCARGNAHDAKESKSMDLAHIWLTEDVQYGGLSVSFPRAGPVQALVSGNLGDAQEIGDYAADLGRGPYDRLRELKRRAGFDTIPPSGPAQPGMPGITFGETEDGKSFDMKAWRLWEIPPAMKPVFDEAHTLTNEVLAHPVRVVRGRGAAQPTAPAGGLAAFEISLESIGTERLLAANPLSTANPEFANLRLVVFPEASGTGENHLWIDVMPQDVSGVPGASRAEDVELAPGQKLAFTVRRKLLASPGRHRAFVLYYATPKQRRNDALSGTLRVDLGAFDIPAPKGR